MGARHALFRPFAAPRTEKIPESPRGWYGADRQAQQGRPQFCAAAVPRLRCTDQGSAGRMASGQNARVFRAAAHPDPGNDRRGGPYRHPGDIVLAAAAARGQVQQGHVSGADGRTSHASRRDRGSSGECVGADPASDRPRARRRRLAGPSHAPRSHELRAGGHSPGAHRSPDGRSAVVRSAEQGHGRAQAGPDLDMCSVNMRSPALTTCRRRWRSHAGDRRRSTTWPRHSSRHRSCRSG